MLNEDNVVQEKKEIFLDREIFEKVDHVIKKKIKKKIKKILLINPPQFQTSCIDFETFKNRRYFNYPPYGLGLLRGVITRETGVEVEILDLNLELLQTAKKIIEDNNVEEFSKLINQIKIISMFKEKKLDYNFESYQDQAFNEKKKMFYGLEIIDLMIPCLTERLKKFNPDMVGISCMFTMTHKRMIKIAEEVKRYNEDILVFSGGVHPTSSAKSILNETKNIDFVSLFEGDNSVPGLIKYLNEDNFEIKNLRQLSILSETGQYLETGERIYPSGDVVNQIPDYGNLPVNKYSELGEIGAYRFWWKKNTIASTALSNRGCRARCSFCSVRNFNGKGVRGKSYQAVVDELQFLNEKYGVNHFMWLDDDLLFDRERTISMFNEIVKRNLKITWDASNGIIASALKDEVLEAAAESGCIGMHFGIESGSDEILKQVHKPSGKKHYLELENKLKKYPQIFTKGFLMVGFPNETLAQIKETIDMAVQINLDWYTIQVVHPLPKTEMHEQLVQMGLISKDEIEDEKLNYGNRNSKEKTKEKTEKLETSNFFDPFTRNLDRVPSQEEMENIWFTADFKINYERIFKINDMDKLNKLDIFLTHIGQKISSNNPFVNYFRSIILNKMNNNDQTKLLLDKSKNFLEKSDYWKKRFTELRLM
jgi:radical SAM superfamily enzyme YgiQ (UPF0313 family)